MMTNRQSVELNRRGLLVAVGALTVAANQDRVIMRSAQAQAHSLPDRAHKRSDRASLASRNQ